MLSDGRNLAYNVAVARLLGPRAFGHAAAVYTLLILASAATLAFQIVCAKLVSQQSTPQEKSAAYRVLHRCAWGCGLLAAFALFVLRGWIAAWLHLPTPLLVMLLAVGVAFYVPLGARRGYAQGALSFRRFAGNLALEGAVRLVGSLIAIGLGFGVAGVIAANAAAVAICWIAIAPSLASPAAGALRLPRASREVLQALVFYSGLVLINNSGIVLVKHYLLPVEAGLYAAVAMVGRVIFLFSSAVVNSMFPVVAGARPEERRSGRALRAALFLVVGVGVAAVVALRLMPAAVWRFILSPLYNLRPLEPLLSVCDVRCRNRDLLAQHRHRDVGNVISNRQFQLGPACFQRRSDCRHLPVSRFPASGHRGAAAAHDPVAGCGEPSLSARGAAHSANAWRRAKTGD